MAIRKNLNPRQMDLQPEMRDILMRNGMQAHIIANGDGYQLVVQGQLCQQEGIQCLYKHHWQRFLYAEKPCPCKER